MLEVLWIEEEDDDMPRAALSIKHAFLDEYVGVEGGWIWQTAAIETV